MSHPVSVSTSVSTLAMFLSRRGFRLRAVLAAAFCLMVTAASAAVAGDGASAITRISVPDGGIQPQVVVDDAGTIHLVYYTGEGARGDLFYVKSSDQGASFSAPVAVNSQSGSAVAAGVIRGAQIAVGVDGRVHVAWNGSGVAKPKGPLNPGQPSDSPHNGLPMLYARSNAKGTAFEPQRNLMRKTFALDGGGSVAVDRSGHVYVTWHGLDRDGKESDRRVWVARSGDNGQTFSEERAASAQGTGSCGCCGLRTFADSQGTFYGLYRSATAEVHRDIYLVASSDHGKIFRSQKIHAWEIQACPMSSMSFAEGSGRVLAAWETEGQVYWAPMDASSIDADVPASEPLAPDGPANRRKYPSLAVSSNGYTLLAWNEGASWGKAGALAWQVFDENNKPAGEPGAGPALPKWSFAAAVTLKDGSFRLVY